MRSLRSNTIFLKKFRSSSSTNYFDSDSDNINRDYSELDGGKRNKAKGLGYMLQKDIVNQIYPKTHLKIHQFWYRIRQINHLHKNFGELVGEIMNDEIVGILF